jgi:putative transposon-encoded protein
MRPYTGDLSVAEIMVLIPKHSGSFSMNFDEEKLRQKRLPSVGDSLTLEVELAPFGTGMVRVSSAMVKLPKSWAGKTVIVTVQ